MKSSTDISKALSPANFKDLCDAVEKGVDFAVVLGNFLDDFYLATTDKKIAMLALEPPKNAVITDVQLTYLAGIAEHLSKAFSLPMQSWVNKSQYFLSEDEANYGGSDAKDTPPKLQFLFEMETPLSFSKRNLFVSSNVLTRA